MTNFRYHPQIVGLARDLGLSTEGDCQMTILGFAMARAKDMTEDFYVDNFETMRLLVANRLRIKLEFIYTNEDVERIANEYEDQIPFLERILRKEFIKGHTEGLTLLRPDAPPEEFCYLAVIDGRGDRVSRVYFTSWHEIAHLLIHPTQTPFPTVRRSPTEALIRKDPIEQLVDAIAGRLAFYPELFAPVVERFTRKSGLSFAAIEKACEEIAPSASLYAATLGSIEITSVPTLFVTVAIGYKKEEERHLKQQSMFEGHVPKPEAKLRVRDVIANKNGLKAFKIRENMRVPERSVLTKAFRYPLDTSFRSNENQSWWETSSTGNRPPMPLIVEAVRRGRYVYGLIMNRF